LEDAIAIANEKEIESDPRVERILSPNALDISLPDVPGYADPPLDISIPSAEGNDNQTLKEHHAPIQQAIEMIVQEINHLRGRWIIVKAENPNTAKFAQGAV
jgi:hypothetical protein